jgi:Protein of unknown function (DUF3237)
LRLEPLLRAEISLAIAQELGITGGSFAGELDARYTLETDDGALVYVSNFGSSEAMRRLAAGEPVDPSLYHMRTTARFETSAERYRWLNGLICVASGARRAASVELEVFAVR